MLAISLNQSISFYCFLWFTFDSLNYFYDAEFAMPDLLLHFVLTEFTLVASISTS